MWPVLPTCLSIMCEAYDAPLGLCLQVKGRRTAHDKEIYMFDGKEVDFKKVKAQGAVC